MSICPRCKAKIREVPLQEDIVIGKYYKIDKLINSGGMGELYRATHTLTEQVVAIKTPLFHLSKDRDIKDRFIREARILAKLEHENITNIYSFFEDHGRLFLVMPFIEGEDLHNILNTCGCLQLDNALNIFLQILEGLKYIHEKGVVHRDIKPANIIISKEGKVKLSDFGISFFLTELEREQSIPLGTLMYMAPEQLRGEMGDFSSDLYSCGITLFEILTGRQPFIGDDYDVISGHIEREVPDIREFRDDISREIWKIIKKTLQKYPSERYQSAEELMRVLSPFSSLSQLEMVHCSLCGAIYPKGEGLSCDSCGSEGICPRHFTQSLEKCDFCINQQKYDDLMAREVLEQKVLSSSIKEKPKEHREEKDISVEDTLSISSEEGVRQKELVESELILLEVEELNRVLSDASELSNIIESDLATELTEKKMEKAFSQWDELMDSREYTPHPLHRIKTKLIGTDDLSEMIYIPADYRGNDPRMKNIKGFFIDIAPVTNERYRKFVEAMGYIPPPQWLKSENGRSFKFSPRELKQSVSHVSYYDAIAFCQWAGKRLPTREEFYKAIAYLYGEKNGRHLLQSLLWEWCHTDKNGSPQDMDSIILYRGYDAKINSHEFSIKELSSFTIASDVGFRCVADESE